MQVQLNMKNVGSLFDAVPDDTYRIRVAGLEDKSGEKGPYVKMDLMIVEGEFAETRQMSENMNFSKASLPITKKMLEALTGQKWEDDDMAFDTEELLGLEAIVSTKTEPFTRQDGTNGVSSKVKTWYPVPENDTQGSL